MSERITAAEYNKTKPKKPRVDREGPIHRDILGYLRDVFPHGIVHHCKNEIKKRGWSIAKELAQAKVDGVVTGFPDLMVIPYAHVQPMFFEVKAEGNYLSPAQKEVHARMKALGQRVAVVRSIDDTREALHEWGIPTMHADPLKGAIS